MGLADLHIHTSHSLDGTCTVSAVLKYVADSTYLNVVAITDHDQIDGALEAVDLAPKYGLEVIPGIEITTADGHLLALWMREVVPAGLPLAETLARVGEAGGLCVAAHPRARGAHSLGFSAIRRALEIPGLDQILVGMETYNAGQLDQRSSLDCQALARSLPIAALGSSDAHTTRMIGWGATAFHGQTAAELQAALQSRATQMVMLHPSSRVRLVGGFLPRYLLRRAGWVTWNSEPQAPLRLARMSRIFGSPAR